jgi:uncharacterized membrane protein
LFRENECGTRNGVAFSRQSGSENPDGGAMASCSKCGSALAAGASFCSVCGSPVSTSKVPEVPPAPPTNAAGSGMSSNVAGALAYLVGLITGIVFLISEPYKRDKFVRFHAFQSIFLNAVVIVFGIVWSNIIAALVFSIGFFWGLFGLIGTLVYFAFFILWLFSMYKAYNKEMYKLPIIGEIAEKQAAK